MKGKFLIVILIITFLMTVTACAKNDIPENEEANLQEKHSIVGISIGDHKDKVVGILGKEYIEDYREEAGHFPEAYDRWDFEEGFTIIIGKDSEEVFQINATTPIAETNLGIKVGDSAEKAISIYREKYIEPESIHGGRLIGVFKVEDGQALILDFNTEDGIANPMEIKPDDKVERIILTYPAYIDDSF